MAKIEFVSKCDGGWLRRLLICGLQEIPQKLALSSLFKVQLVANEIEMRNAFLVPDVIGILVYLERLNLDGWRNLKKLAIKYPQKHFIFIGQHIDKSVKIEVDKTRNCSFLWPHEEGQISIKIKQILGVHHEVTRRSDRKRVQAPLIIKASEIMEESPIGHKMKAVMEGTFVDFSKHGAKLVLKEGWLAVKDYICIMYQKSGGEWVSMESQIRWTERDPSTGCFFMGVQFIARVS